ncbi:Uncharacterised protein [Yersinia intermedia]|nr:Uncharacterised protein [Yersinia intermedia]
MVLRLSVLHDPYSIEMVMIKKVKKMLDKSGGDLFVVSFNLDNKPLVLDSGIGIFSINDIEQECKVITQLPIQYKGYRCWSIVLPVHTKGGNNGCSRLQQLLNY